MQSLWNDREAALYRGDLALRVYSSRLLGRDPSLVLHGGGNTSVKISQTNLVGKVEDILYVKGSGWDLETIEEAGFTPVRMPHMLELCQLDRLSDSEMVNELKTQMTRANAPSPSVETILHAILPHKYVDHTHADAIVTITNTERGRDRIQSIYGDRAVIIPYIMPGFDLAKLCAERFAAEAHAGTTGMVLMNHGLFSFGATARESYERTIALVSEAEAYLQQQGAWQIPHPKPQYPECSPARELAQMRAEISRVAGFPAIVSRVATDKTLAFAQRSDVSEIALQGPATPDHVIRTKRIPLIGRDVEAHARTYCDYFQRNHAARSEPKIMLDPAPRLILDPEWGLLAIGQTARAAKIAADIYDHTIEVIERATVLGGYRALSERDIFDMEYWELEQAKLAQGGESPEFTGEIALVTGAASGIGRACVDSLLERGAAVVGLDVNPAVATLHKRPDYLGLSCDLTDETAVVAAIERAIETYGGIDMAILNAGIFPAGCPIGELSSREWHRVLSINLDANLTLMRECHPYLKLSPRGGRVVAIGSKNVPAPGPGAAAYSASKAALNQLARVAALEWGQDGIRVNSLHPNGVFDTGIWSEEVLQARAERYGLTVGQYRSNNLLKTEVTSHDVAELAAALCSSLFAKTTAAQIPVDGGNDRVI